MIDTYDEYSPINPINQKDIDDIEVVENIRDLIEDNKEATELINEIEGDIVKLMNFFKTLEKENGVALIGRKKLNEILEKL